MPSPHIQAAASLPDIRQAQRPRGFPARAHSDPYGGRHGVSVGHRDADWKDVAASDIASSYGSMGSSKFRNAVPTRVDKMQSIRGWVDGTSEGEQVKRKVDRELQRQWMIQETRFRQKNDAAVKRKPIPASASLGRDTSARRAALNERGITRKPVALPEQVVRHANVPLQMPRPTRAHLTAQVRAYDENDSRTETPGIQSRVWAHQQFEEAERESRMYHYNRKATTRKPVPPSSRRSPRPTAPMNDLMQGIQGWKLETVEDAIGSATSKR